MSKLEWGIDDAAPEGVPTFGARAIHGRQDVELVHDRKSTLNLEGLTKAEIQRFSEWITQTLSGISVFTLDSGKAEPHTIEDDDYCLVYDTKGSCGYVYIAAWVKGGAA